MTSPRLTPREAEVLALVAQGLTSVAVGRRLGVSRRTVQKHVENINRKLRTPTRLAAVLHAQWLGLLTSPYDRLSEGDGSVE